MADDPQKHTLSAFALLVDAANAQQASRPENGGGGGKEDNKPPATTTISAGTPQPQPALSSATVDALKAAAAASASRIGENSSGAGGAMTPKERAEAIRQAALAAQLQQYSGSGAAGAAPAYEGNGAAAENWEAVELQEALQREMLHREAMRRQQQAAAYMGLCGGSPFGGGGGENNLAAAQEAEYLQQLRLEALVQQRRQETLAQLALAQELGMSPDMQAILEAEQLRQAALRRQEMLLQAAAAGNGAFGASGNGGIEGILRALGAGGMSEEGIMQILQERERQRKLALLVQAQQVHQQHQLQRAPQPVGSSPALTGSSGLPLRGAHGSGMERADLIGSVFAKNATSTPTKAAVPAPAQKLTPEEAAAAALAQEASPFATMMVGQDGSKTTILRCGARNMPMDHNVKTAYFVVPEDAKHGTELVCSHLKCRNSGVKFRFCVYCRIPVAKRNFAKRHRHAGKIPKSELPSDFDLLLEEEEAAEEAAQSKEKGPQQKKWTPQELLDALMEQNIPELQAGGQNIPKPPFTGEVLDTIVAKRQEEWDKLLLERPTAGDSSAMTAWVLQLLRVSDMEKIAAAFTPCVPVPTKNLKNKNPGLKKKKRRLLSKRSKSDEEKPSPSKLDEKVSPKSLVEESTAASKGVVEGVEKVAGDHSSDLERPPQHVLPADDSSTSSEDSVDLRASKKARQ